MKAQVKCPMKAEVLIDWLTFSVSTKRYGENKSHVDVSEFTPQEVIKHFLGMDPFLFQETGAPLPGYACALSFNGIFVAYEPRENDHFKNMGICVSMSGNGCRTFESMSTFGPVPFDSLSQLLADTPGSNVSRIDIACDDHSGVLDMDVMLEKVRLNNINSRMSKRRIVTGWDGLDKDGSTIYIGSEKSAFRLRVYDKALEQGTKEYWIRVEMVLREKQSNAFVAQMVQGVPVGQLAASVLNDKFSFIDRDDSNISRCTVCSWWSDFVGTLATLHLVTRPEPDHAVVRIDRWVYNQVAPSLAVLAETYGLGHVIEIAMTAYDRLSQKQRALIHDFRCLEADTK